MSAYVTALVAAPLFNACMQATVQSTLKKLVPLTGSKDLVE